MCWKYNPVSVSGMFNFFYYEDNIYIICDRLQENRAQRGVRKYREKIDWFLKNVLFQANEREWLGLL